MKYFVLHSGGLDSTVALYRAVNLVGPENVISVGVDYGQRHIRELEGAMTICDRLDVRRVVLKIEDMPDSMLTNKHVPIPDASYADLPEGVSPTYVPFRNGQLIAKAAALASSTKEKSIISMGMHFEDTERDAYPDCTLQFIGAMAAAVYIGTYHLVTVDAPFLSFTKAQIVELGDELDVPFHLTWSCYAGDDFHCGICPTCRARKAAFQVASVYDGTMYADVVADESPF